MKSAWLGIIIGAAIWLAGDGTSGSGSGSGAGSSGGRQYSSDDLHSDPPGRSKTMRLEDVEVSPELDAKQFAGALERGDAGLLARLIEKFPAAAEAATARERLQTGPVWCLTRDGRLPDGGDAILLGAFGLTCDASERELVAATGATPKDRTVKIRYTQDYRKGLGRKVGGHRMAPHPKRINLRLFPVLDRDGKEDTLVLTAVTSSIKTADLSEMGLTEEEVWQQTLEKVFEQLKAGLK